MVSAYHQSGVVQARAHAYSCPHAGATFRSGSLYYKSCLMDKRSRTYTCAASNEGEGGLARRRWRS